jgi:hypothetical protein
MLMKLSRIFGALIAMPITILVMSIYLPLFEITRALRWFLFVLEIETGKLINAPMESIRTLVEWKRELYGKQ